ncbi:MAG: acyl-CoA reductase [Arenibacter sp.]|nr:acyl-CoA reductase [Arenibacter sp.]
MSDLTQRIKAFAKLGDFFSEYSKYAKKKSHTDENQPAWFQKFDETLSLAKHHNGWFTPENILYSFDRWAELLTATQLQDWLSDYEINKNTSKKVALIMAGNIPLVGFHDFLCTIISGNTALIKLSSNDKVLLPLVAEYITEIEPSLANQISFVEGKLENFDAVIATGSDNTSRYFEHYFGKKPNIIRKNRNSAAILTGQETKEQLSALGEDIFRYYGLGCRSVSKIYVPKGYDFDLLFNALYPFKYVIEQHKYANNYDYNKAVYLMSLYKVLENGFLMLKEDKSYASPIATVFYEYYDSLEDLKNRLSHDSDLLQCIVANGVMPNEIPFGTTQKPSLEDYADNVDTVDFLLKT